MEAKKREKLNIDEVLYLLAQDWETGEPTLEKVKNCIEYFWEEKQDNSEAYYGQMLEVIKNTVVLEDGMEISTIKNYKYYAEYMHVDWIETEEIFYGFATNIEGLADMLCYLC